MKKRKVLIALLVLYFAAAIQANAMDRQVDPDDNTVKGQTFSGLNGYKTGGGIFYNGGEGKTAHTLEGATFSGNYANYAGGVYSATDVTVNSSSFLNNTATNSGGAIYQASGGKLGVNDSYFSGNQTTVTEGGQGGAITSFSDTTITNSVFDKNKSTQIGGAILQASGNLTITGGSLTGNEATYYGGGIYVNDGSSNLDIDGTIFTENKTYTPTTTGSGGAIYVKGANSNVAVKNATFANNESGNAGAIFSNASKLDITNTAFNNNSASGNYQNNSGYGNGGAVVTNGETTITDSSFSGNNALSWGGAVFQGGDNKKLTVSNSSFIGNTAAAAGGIVTSGEATISGSNFDSNVARNGFGGAIYNNSSQGSGLTVSDTDFSRNTALRGGAIFGNEKAKTSVSGGVFSGNSVSGRKDKDGNLLYGQGGAIFTNRESDELKVTGAIFDGNSAENEGGAIWSGNKTEVENSLFQNNSTTGTAFTADNPNYQKDAEGGGAIFVGSNSKASVKNSDFLGNSSSTVGGAIATRSNAEDNHSSLTVEGSNFSGNSAVANGGAIATYLDSTITDSSFAGNSSGAKGGAIWSNGDLTVEAKDKDIIFSGNFSADGGDIYMDNLFNESDAGKTLTLNAGDDRSITLEDGVSGKLGTTEDNKKYKIEINKSGKEGSSHKGTVAFKGEIKNADVTVSDGTLHLAEGNSLNNTNVLMKNGTTLDTTDGAYTSYGEDAIKTEENGKINLKTDISSATGQTDSFAGVKGEVTLLDFNPVGDTLLSSGSVSIDDLKTSLGLTDEGTTLEVGNLAKQEHKFLSPLRWLNASATDTEISFGPTGSRYEDFNPAIMAGAVAAQLGGYLTQLNSYDEAFRNMDMYMLMTKKQRQAMKLRNKYAASDSNLVFDPTNTIHENSTGWIRPYATFEKVDLKGGPNVSNVAYGSFFGGESPIIEVGNGWDVIWGAYAGYNGSHQVYDGISIYQNGGTLGLIGMAYKGDFFTGLTVNAGANSGRANSIYGDEDFTLLMSGIASKTGYNFELLDGKFIIQPSYLMSYSFVNTFDYTSAAGIKVRPDALNAIQIEPGIKLIGNLKNGWQPYLGVSFVWNIMDKTDFKASDATLPELSIKPFVKYGIGVRKNWGERFTGFFQTYFTNGGRNGVGLQAGFSLAIGKDPKTPQKTSQKSPLILPKTVVKLSSVK